MMFRLLLILFPICAAPAADISYWIEACTNPHTSCHAGDPELAQWALDAWEAAARGHIHFLRTDSPDQALIRIHWASGVEGQYGEARFVVIQGKRRAEVYVRPELDELGPEIARAGKSDPLLRDAIVYLTCLHESGHALGLDHTSDFADIMYSFQYGGDIPEYFQRYRRKLHTRTDIRKNAGMSSTDQERPAQDL